MSGRVLFIDPVEGLAGDMLCGALLDAGGDLDALRADLRGLGLDGFAVEAHPVMRGAFAATWFRVRPTEDAGEVHAHTHQHAHGHGHTHQHAHAEPVFPGQPERTWRTIRALLEAAALPARARSRALETFSALADAEARMHGVAPEDVHFHEVGGVDAIVDITAACLLLEQLGVDEVVVGPIPVGSGHIQAAHGRIPLPAPATARLLAGFPILPGRTGMEQTTPTGAALLAALATPGPLPAMTLDGQGFGAGTRDPADHANVCRVLLGRRAAGSPTDVVVVAAQVDDMTGEHLPPLIDALLAAGALDATATPTVMKKGRAGLRIEALTTPDRQRAVEVALLRHSSTFGVRSWPAARRVLDRRHIAVDTPWGGVRVKVGTLEGEVLHVAPEFEDVRARATAADVPVRRVHWAAIRAFDEAAEEEGSE